MDRSGQAACREPWQAGIAVRCVPYPLRRSPAQYAQSGICSPLGGLNTPSRCPPTPQIPIGLSFIPPACHLPAVSSLAASPTPARHASSAIRAPSVVGRHQTTLNLTGRWSSMLTWSPMRRLPAVKTSPSGHQVPQPVARSSTRVDNSARRKNMFLEMNCRAPWRNAYRLIRPMRICADKAKDKRTKRTALENGPYFHEI